MVQKLPKDWNTKNLNDVIVDIIDYREKTPKKLGGSWSESGIIALSAMNVKQGQLVNLEKARFVSDELYGKWMKSEVSKGDILMTSEPPLVKLTLFQITKKSAPRDTKKPFVPMKSATERSMLITDVEEKTGNSGAKFKNGDTLFARITPCLENGRTGFVQFLPNDDYIAFGSTEFIVLRSKTLNPYFVYLLAQTRDFRENAIKSMSGATGRQRVINQCFDDYFLPTPNQGILEQFKSTVAPLFTKVQNLSEKNTNLRQTRDFLLPKLISSEIDVSDLDIDIDPKSN